MPFTSTKLRLDAAFAGMLVDAQAHDTDSYVQEEASAEVPFGVMVMQGTADNGAKLIASNAGKLIGIVRHQQAYQKPTELGSTGLKPATTLGVLKRGKIWVPVSEAVTPASAVRVRMDANAGANGTTSGPGCFCTTSSAGHTQTAPYARFLSTTTGAGLVQLELDMSSRASGVND